MSTRLRQLHTAWLQPSDRASLLGTIKPVTDMLERYKDGLKQHERSVIRNLITQYLSVEKVRKKLTNSAGCERVAVDVHGQNASDRAVRPR